MNALPSQSSPPVRVLWVCKGLGRGGAERLITLGARHLDADRFTVEVAYLLPHKDAFVPDLVAAGVPVHCLGARGWPARLARLTRDRRFALVHTHSPVPATVARLTARRGVPVVHTEHNVWPRFRAPTRVANAATYGRNARVFAVSQAVADSITRPGWAPWLRLPPVEVLLHGIDESAVRRGPDARAAARRALGIDDADEVVGHVATFTPKKDHHGLLDAFAALAADRPRLRLVLIGTGPLEDEVRARVTAAGLDDRVGFLGVRDDVQALLPGFDVFTLPSRHEGLPIAMLEAMAAGVPVVVSDVGGVREALTDGQEGLLVPAADPPAVAAALAKLLDDAALRAAMGERGAQRATRFSIAAAVRRQEAVYTELLERR